jgi:mannose-6-phosphate isomerase-like protein (cupin superfamily)
MVKYKKDMETIMVENTGNIEGKIAKEVILTPQEMLDKALMCNRIILPVGSSIKVHSHNPEAEIYYILEGEVSVVDNEQEVVLGVGDVVFTGNSEEQGIKNIGTSDAVFLAVILKEMLLYRALLVS